MGSKKSKTQVYLGCKVFFIEMPSNGTKHGIRLISNEEKFWDLLTYDEAFYEPEGPLVNGLYVVKVYPEISDEYAIKHIRKCIKKAGLTPMGLIGTSGKE